MGNFQCVPSQVFSLSHTKPHHLFKVGTGESICPTCNCYQRTGIIREDGHTLVCMNNPTCPEYHYCTLPEKCTWVPESILSCTCLSEKRLSYNNVINTCLTNNIPTKGICPTCYSIHCSSDQKANVIKYFPQNKVIINVLDMITDEYGNMKCSGNVYGICPMWHFCEKQNQNKCFPIQHCDCKTKNGISTIFHNDPMNYDRSLSKLNS